MEERDDGELKVAGVRVGGSGVLEVRGGALARELGCGESRGAEANERKGAGALPRACHGGHDVAAAQHDRGSVARGGGLQREWSGARGLRECRVWRWVAGGGLPAFLSGGGAALRRRQRKQRERERGGR